MKRFFYSLVAAGIILLGMWGTAFAVSTFTVPQGGTGANSFTSSNLLYGNGTKPLSSVATTSVSCGGSASCTSFTAIGAAPVTISVSGGSGSTIATTSGLSIGQGTYYTSITPTILGGFATGTISSANSALTVTGNRAAIGGATVFTIATTSTSMFTGTAGQVLGFLNGGWAGVPTTTFTGSGPIATAFLNGQVTISCATCNTSSATVSSVNVGSTGSTLAFTNGPITTSGTINGELNLGHTNLWTILQQFMGNASSTQLSANIGYFGATGTTSILSTGEISSVDAGTGYTGQITPLKALTLQTGTTTTWTATTSGAYIPSATAPFAGTLRDISCVASTTKAFLGVTTFINSGVVAPSYMVASSTAGIVKYTGSNTFNRGDSISIQVGTTTTDTNANAMNCTLRATQTI